MVQCEWCKSDHDGTYASGRFCSRKCACTRIRTAETKKKISKSRGGIEEQERFCVICQKSFLIKYSKHLNRKYCSSDCANQSQLKGKFNPSSIWDCSPKTISKILKRLEKMYCSNCGWNQGTCDIHHIHGRKIENCDHHSNLTLLCPNCHRLVHEKKITLDKLITLEQFIGDSWKEVYFG